MVTELKTKRQNLYDTDYNLWTIETVKQLQLRDLDSLDWNNLIEEVSDLSRRDKRKLKNLLRRLFEHLLKLKYWQSEVERNQNHWKGEIRNFRKQIKDELNDSPSLLGYLREILEECYQDSKQIVSDKSQLLLNIFPENSIATIEQIIDENWLP